MSNEINWCAWNDESRQRALNEQKLIMVFCEQHLDHWSRRWLREIQQHTELCGSINQLCIPVMVRVEQEIELAARAQEVLAVTSDAQGFPAIIWLTPNGNPLGGTPYRPLLDGEKMRGFAPMFIDIIEAWHQQRQSLEADVEQMRDAWRLSDSLIDVRSSLSLDRLVDALEAHIMSQADSLEGGFGSAPRELPVYFLSFLLKRMRAPSAAPSIQEHVVKTLNALIAGGIHDHLGGGFFRAATDDSWNIPFFEKRAIDQINMIPVLIEAAEHCQSPVYVHIAQECLDLLHASLRLPDGVCAWGLSAESTGGGQQQINGAAYLWSYQVIEDVIGRDAASIIHKRFLSDQRCFIDEEFAVLAIRDELSVSEREQLPALCQRLAQARMERPLPQRDETQVLHVQAMLLRLFAYIHQQSDLQVDQSWADDIQRRLLDSIYTNAVERSLAALAVLEWDQVKQQNNHANWIKEQAVALRHMLNDNKSMSLIDQPIFVDRIIAGPDNSDYPSAVGLCYQLWMQLDGFEKDAEQLIQAYAPLIRAAPLAHSSLLSAYLDCKKT